MFEDFIQSLDKSKDKTEILQLLSKLATILEESENDYKKLIDLIENIEVSALWIIDNNGEIFTQNKKSLAINGVLNIVDFSKGESEVEFKSRFYLIQIKHNDTKFIITASDITKSKQEERLISMGKMASHLAHEIRNPIGSVSLLASTLLSEVTSEQREIVTDIQKAIWRVERIIQATLLFGKDIPNIQFDNISIDDIKLGIQESLQYYSYEKDISLNVHFPSNIFIKVNFDLLLIVFQNMIFNAIDAIEEQMSESENIIDVNYSSNDIYHIFSFYDNGVDIEDKTILFQAYKSTKVKGNGLGLVLAQKIIKAHGGKIQLSNEKKEFLIFIKKEA